MFHLDMVTQSLQQLHILELMIDTYKAHLHSKTEFDSASYGENDTCMKYLKRNGRCVLTHFRKIL